MRKIYLLPNRERRLLINGKKCLKVTKNLINRNTLKKKNSLIKILLLGNFQKRKHPLRKRVEDDVACMIRKWYSSGSICFPIVSSSPFRLAGSSCPCTAWMVQHIQTVKRWRNGGHHPCLLVTDTAWSLSQLVELGFGYEPNI